MAASALDTAQYGTTVPMMETINYSTTNPPVNTGENTEVEAIPTTDPGTAAEKAKGEIAGAYGSAIDQIGQDRQPFSTYNPEETRGMLDKTNQFKPADSYINKATDTVAGQLESLLAKESPLMKQAASRGEVAASRRGQLGSSMGIGAAQASMISQALPIAQQDAQTFAQASGRQQAAEYGAVTSEKEATLSGQVQKYTTELQRQDKDIDQRFQAIMKSADATTSAALEGMQQQYKQDLAKLDGQIREVLMNKEIDAKAKQMAYEQSANILQNYQITVENMMTNPDFLALGKDSMVNAINQIQNLATNQVNFIGNAVGIDFTDLIDFYFEDVLTVSDFSGMPDATPVPSTPTNTGPK